jgi:hypothetical protein
MIDGMALESGSGFVSKGECGVARPMDVVLAK